MSKKLSFRPSTPRVRRGEASPDRDGRAATGRGRFTVFVTVVAAAVLASGCSNLGERTGSEAVGSGEVDVVTTTNFITDTVRQIGGRRVSVRALMGPGVDPHLYKASAGDVGALRDADVIFHGGLFLEAKMEEVFDEIGESRPVRAVTDSMPRELLLAAQTGASAEEEYDPHVWFDPTLWRYAAQEVRDGLTEADPKGARIYSRNTREFLADLRRMDQETRRILVQIPERRRVLVTSHDAFRYLGRRYGVEVAAIQGISTAAEATTEEIEQIARLVAERGVRSVFIESSVPRQTVEAVLASAREMGQDTTIGGELYSDSAGELGTPEGTYQGMFRSNVEKLFRGLR
ncbi:MAG: zinc ABC transporter substrate-binding protein [Solirubrobacterales bacterium]